MESGSGFKNAVLEKYALNTAGIEAAVSKRVIELSTQIERQSSMAALTRLLRM